MNSHHRVSPKVSCASCDNYFVLSGCVPKRCAACKLVCYCSQQCQKKDWRRHRQRCREFSRLASLHVPHEKLSFWTRQEFIAKAKCVWAGEPYQKEPGGCQHPGYTGSLLWKSCVKPEHWQYQGNLMVPLVTTCQGYIRQQGLRDCSGLMPITMLNPWEFRARYGEEAAVETLRELEKHGKPLPLGNLTVTAKKIHLTVRLLSGQSTEFHDFSYGLRVCELKTKVFEWARHLNGIATTKGILAIDLIHNGSVMSPDGATLSEMHLTLGSEIQAILSQPRWEDIKRQFEIDSREACRYGLPRLRRNPYFSRLEPISHNAARVIHGRTVHTNISFPLLEENQSPGRLHQHVQMK